jgi:N-formylglutamate amidohydrolase
MTNEFGPPVEVDHPEGALCPIVVSSPHSGRIYPPSLLADVGVGMAELRRLEDGCVDRLFASAPRLGAPLLHARFARAYVDPNREAYEIEADLIRPPLPAHVKVGSLKAKAGLGVIPSRINGRRIYRRRLDYAEAERRIEIAYQPYHRMLQRLLDRPHAEFGTVLLLDVHSMPSRTADGCRGDEPAVDVALGDRYGRACASVLVERAATLLRGAGLRVGRNRPYAGGQITARYGRPDIGAHALQIEIRRDLFLEEASLKPLPSLNRMARLFETLLFELDGLVREFRPPPPALAACTAS